jgi:hypothetical protein
VNTKISWRKRIVTLILGLTVNELIVQGFDSVLYPWVMGTLGFLHGGLVMIFASFLICLLTIEFYDWSKTDWLGIETLKEAREMKNTKANRFIAKFMKNSKWAQLVILSIAQDPFIVMVFLREGAHQYGGMKKEDWINFYVSLIIANLFWATVCWSGVAIFEKIGLKLGEAITLMSLCLILIALTGFIVGKVNERREAKLQILARS